MAPPNHCELNYPLYCEGTVINGVTNVPNTYCPSSKWYQPPIPINYTTSDIDCNDKYWKDTCTVTYCKREADAQLQAGTIMSIPYIISACLSPFLGGFVDRFGMRAVIATISPSVLVVVHSFLGYTTVDPVGPLVGQGLAYSGFASVLWPSIAMVVEERLVGLGYGIVVSIQNLGLAIFPLIVAQIYNDYGHAYCPAAETFFVCCAFLGVIIGLYLNYYDYFHLDSILNRGLQSNNNNNNTEERSKSATYDLINPLVFDDQQVRILAPDQANNRNSNPYGEDSENPSSNNNHNNRTKSSELFVSSMIH
jgi:hypothetical protein